MHAHMDNYDSNLSDKFTIIRSVSHLEHQLHKQITTKIVSFVLFTLLLWGFFVLPLAVHAAQENVPFRDITRDVVGSAPQLRPSQFGGAFTYEHPIVVPPGRGEMMPDIKLTYASHGGEDIGIYGYGWSDSIPFVEHINKTGTDKRLRSK